LREQLSLFPEKSDRPKLQVLESCVDEDAESVRIDPEFEESLDPSFRYHPECVSLLDSNSSRVGDWAEKKVQCIAMSLGLEVYANISCVGLADIVVKSNDTLAMIDVKLAHRHYSGSGKIQWYQCRSKEIKWSEGVYGVCLIPAMTGIYCRWYNKQKGAKITPIHPPGCRDIWLPSLPSNHRTVA
tara:strand:- start:1850 stop:2404 length:555 start_codon:yes stop_codon:yes gene_type:complete